MANLPVDCCTIRRPFTVSGVDFAGPFLCRLILTCFKIYFKVYVRQDVFLYFSTRTVQSRACILGNHGSFFEFTSSFTHSYLFRQRHQFERSK